MFDERLVEVGDDEVWEEVRQYGATKCCLRQQNGVEVEPK